MGDLSPVPAPTLEPNLELQAANPLLARIAGVACLLSALVLGAWLFRGVFRAIDATPLPSMRQAAELAQAGKLDEAEALVQARLLRNERDPEANLLEVQILLARSSAAGMVPDGSKASDDRSRTYEPPPAGPLLKALAHVQYVPGGDPQRLAEIYTLHGNIYYRLLNLTQAESIWIESLRLSATALEAGWGVLEIHYLEGRLDEARKLALQLSEVGPGSRDRSHFLVELLRQQARPLAPDVAARWFEPVVARHPEDRRASSAWSLALVRSSQVERGLDVLDRLVGTAPSDIEVREALFQACDDAGDIPRLRAAIAKLPAGWVELPTFAAALARLEQEDGHWDEAARLWREAWNARPFNDSILARLIQALRNAGRTSEADRLETDHRTRVRANDAINSLYEEANNFLNQKIPLSTDFCLRVARNRRSLGLLDESLAWYRLALETGPADDAARAELLEVEGTLRDRAALEER